jgi:hypothetical protein
LRLARPCRVCPGRPQQRLQLSFGQTFRAGPLRHLHEPDFARHIPVHEALVERPAKQLLDGLQLAVDGGRLEALGTQDVLAVIDEIDGRDAAQVARLGAGFPLEPPAKAAEVMEVPAGR